MQTLEKAEAEAIIYFLKGKVRDDYLPRIRSLLTGENSAAEDNEEDRLEDRLNGTYGMDGRRLVRPASPQALKAFKEEHGIPSRRIRVFGSN